MSAVLKIIKDTIFPPKENGEKDLSNYIDLGMPCLIDENVIITNSAIRMTLIHLDGFTDILNDSIYNDSNLYLSEMFARLFNGKRCTVAWSFQSSKEEAVKEIRRAVAPGRLSAKKLHIDDRLFFDDVLNANEKIGQSEQCWIAVWSYPEFELEYTKKGIIALDTPNIPLMKLHKQLFEESANPFKSAAQSVNDHKNNYLQIIDSFRRLGCVVKVIPAKEAAYFLNLKLNTRIHDNSPLQFVDEKRLGIRNGHGMLINPKTGDCDYSGFFVPTLAEQFSKRSVIEDEDVDGLLKMDGQYYATHTVEVLPRDQVPFNKLKNLLNGIPYRITFILNPKAETFWDRINGALNAFGRAAEENRDSYNQMQTLRYEEEELNSPGVSIQILLITWADTKKIAIAQSKQISDALVSWGGAGMDYDNVSPWQTLCTSIAGMNPRSHAIGGYGTIKRITPILPHQHEASIIPRGPIVFNHSSTGKPYYYGPNQSLQDYDLTLYLAKPRQGKSLLMNAKSIANMVIEAAEGINLVASLDIGPNSAGAFQLARMMLQHAYGAEKAKRMIAYHKWDPMQGEWYVNPLDIRFGQTGPTPIEMTFMVSFYSSVCCEPETGDVAPGTTDLLHAALTEVFKRLAPNQNPNRFSPVASEELNKLIKKYRIPIKEDKREGYTLEENVSYFFIRDQLFQHGEESGAILAHSLAMPLVGRLIDEIATNSKLRQKFDASHENLIEQVKYKLSSHISVSPHLSRQTTLNLQEASFISFDLKPLTKEKGTKAGTIRLFSEYLLAMSLSMQRFSLERELLKFPLLSPIYLDYWRERINKYASLAKCLNLDEWHMMTVKQTLPDGRVVSKPVAGAEYIEALIKEAPKWNMNINIATHSASDLTQVMRQKATNIFFYSGFNGEEAAELKELFSLSDEEVIQLKKLHGPRADRGTQILHVQHVNSPLVGNSGRCSCVLNYLCAGSLLWALNTDAKDLPHRLRLEAEFKDKPWMEALIKAFPTGSMKSVREEILEQLRDRSRNVLSDKRTVEEHLYQLAVKKLREISYTQDSINIADSILRANS